MIRDVRITKRAEKKINKLPQSIKLILFLLIREIEEYGPIRGNWKNYGKLSKTKHNCHIKAGRPTYVACWEEVEEKYIIEVYYVGTHEKAPY